MEYTSKDKYVLKLHELLWEFIERDCPGTTGKVVECAEAVLKQKGTQK